MHRKSHSCIANDPASRIATQKLSFWHPGANCNHSQLVEYGNPYCSLGPRFHTVDSHHCSGSLVDQHLKRGDEPTKTHMPLLLMAEILHQLNMENLPFFTGFYKSKRWLALGFMNQQQYQREIPWISKQKWLPYLFVFIFIPPRWGYNFQPCDISSEVVRVFGSQKGFDLARKRVTQSTTKHFLGGGFNPCKKYARQIGLPSGKQT